MLLRLAWRSIWRHRRRTLITIASISLGLTFALYFISLGEGVYSRLTDDIVRTQSGHVTLEHPAYRDAPSVDLWVGGAAKLREQLLGLRGVAGTKVLVLGQGVAMSSHGDVGVAVMGIEPSVERQISPLATKIESGEFLKDDDAAVVFIGAGLAKKLHVKVGKKLVLSAANVHGEFVEELFTVKGIFRTGADEADGYLLLAPLPAIRGMYDMPEGSVTQIAVLLSGPRAKKRVLREARTLLSGRGVAVYPWEEIMPEIASYIRLDRSSNLIFQGLLIVLILFTIFNTILMSVLEREREFAVLLAVGTKPRNLQFQILLESAFIGLIGCALGLALGSAASYITSIYGLDLRALSSETVTVSGFGISLVMYPVLTVFMVVGLGATVFVATLLLSLIPMRRVARVPIVETLR